VIVADDLQIPVRTALRIQAALDLPCVINDDDVSIRYKLGFERLKRDNLLARSDAFLEAAALLTDWSKR
jgi:hypothetical protein